MNMKEPAAQTPLANADPYAPPQIARLVEDGGINKAHLSILQTSMLAVLAGAFIAFGAMFFTLVMTNHGLGFGPSRLLGGIAFSLGLILVVVAGAELFTGNNLIVMAWVDRKISGGALLKNWIIVYVGNFAGALFLAVLVWLSGVLSLGDGAVSQTAIKIAEAKIALPNLEAFFRGILCNTLVCLAVWLCVAARRVSGKILAIIFPISAFVALGFEHSVANMYFIPVAWLSGASISVDSFMGNLIPVTAGNLVGGAGFVALTYWVIYLRHRQSN
jgi:formate transporter